MVALTSATSNASYTEPSPYAWLRSRAPVPTTYAPACEPLSAFDDVLKNRTSRTRSLADRCTGVRIVRLGLVETFKDSGIGVPPVGLNYLTNNYTWSYDNAGRLTSEVLDSTDDTLDQTESYIMDLVGNRIRRTIDKPNTANDVTDIYTFDSSDRLQTENRYSGLFPTGTPGTSTRSTAYTWNTTQQTSKTVSVTGVSSVVQSMSYGLSGQLENVVTTTSNGSGVVSARTQVEYRYDNTGVRFIAIESSDSTPSTVQFDRVENGRTEYLIDHMNMTGYQQTILETVKNPSGQATKRTSYTFGMDEITQTVSNLDPSTGNVTSTETLTFGHDGHGSVRALFGAAAALVQVFTYSAYGEFLAIHNGAGVRDAINGGTASTLANQAGAKTSLLYNGESLDTRTGLYNFRARWYSASNGRFERLDPYSGNPSDPFSFNKYGFTSGDPILHNDPTGMFEGLLGLVIATGIRVGKFAASNPATFGALYGGVVGFFDGLAEEGDVVDAVYAAAWGAAFGFLAGRTLGGVAARLGPWLRTLHPETGIRLLYGMFAANLALTGLSIYSSRSNGQAGFRAALGIMGLVANGAVIANVTKWARQLRNVDTLVLASTKAEASLGSLSTGGRNVVRNNIDADSLGEIGESIAIAADQADLPLPKDIFRTIAGRNVQVEKESASKTFSEWFRVLKPGGEIEVSISQSFISAREVVNGLREAGFQNARQLPGFTYPSAARFAASK
jgi:RHS repeat-associated protein